MQRKLVLHQIHFQGLDHVHIYYVDASWVCPIGRRSTDKPAGRAQEAIRGRGGSKSFHIVRGFIQIRRMQF